MERSKEFDFFLKADLSKYEGKYVVILENKIIAQGNTAKIWEEVKKKFPDKKPMLVKVPKEETLILGLLWK